MIGAFLDSWALFQNTYLAGWAIAVLLALVGIWVVAREQVFLGIAVSQASTLGIALALVLAGGAGGGADLTDLRATGFAVAAAVATALVTARGGGGGGRESAEAVTGWIFLLSASLPVLMLSDSAHGLEEIHRLTFSTLLGASGTDLIVLAAVAALTVALALPLHRRLLLLAMDPETAVALGVRRRRLEVGMAIWLGLCAGLSMRVSGMLYTFGCLVLPALVARSLAREMRPLLWMAPALALAAAGPGFVLAHHFDTPPAHTTVAILCAALAGAWTLRRLRAD